MTTDTITQHGQERPVTITDAANDPVKPNSGSSVQDIDTFERSQALSEWYKNNGIDLGNRIQLVKLSHMRYQHPDLDVITTFLRDFGMHVAKRTDTEVWFKGYGPDQYCYYAKKGEKKFLGGAFIVESYEELVKASKMGGEIQDLAGPGGGKMVTLLDLEGFPVNLIHGQEAAEVGQLPQKIVYNDETDKPRVRKFNRFTPGPAAVHKSGHFGLVIRRGEPFDKQVSWYLKTFNLAPSDFLYVPLPDSGNKGTSPATKDVALFARIDRGETPVDHHTFFMSSGEYSHIHHSSFEVHDYDTQHLGHQWLEKQGYRSEVGIGRHVLGSQLFDYWWDPHEFMIEHYADGDLVNSDTPVGWTMAGDESLAVWGPPIPKTFLD